MAKRYLPFYNNARFIALVLVAFFVIFSISFRYLDLNISISLTQFSFVLLLPLSQIYLAYKGMLDALKLDGLSQSERDRLTSTVDIRSKSSLYVAILFIVIVFSIFVLNSINLLTEKHLLALILSIGLSSIVSFFLAWSDLREISMLEKTLKARKESREA
ncbi:putative membrane protein, partial [Acinetobacter baumannii 25569_7]